MEQLKETTVGSVRGSLWLLFGAVSVLLLIASTNIAALLLARAAKRSQEISMRLSLGAPPATIRSLIFVETAVLAVAGALLGLLVAAGASAALRRLAPGFSAHRGALARRRDLALHVGRDRRGHGRLRPGAGDPRGASRHRRRSERRTAHAGVVAPLAAMAVRRHPGCLVGRAARRRGVADPQLPRALARRSRLRREPDLDLPHRRHVRGFRAARARG